MCEARLRTTSDTNLILGTGSVRPLSHHPGRVVGACSYFAIQAKYPQDQRQVSNNLIPLDDITYHLSPNSSISYGSTTSEHQDSVGTAGYWPRVGGLTAPLCTTALN